MSVITTRSVNMGALEQPLVRCTVSSKFDIARLERAARADPASLPSIRVGIVNGKCYPMGRLDVLTACQAAGAREIRADVKDYDSKLDLMADQIKEVSAVEYIDPLHIKDVINEFGRCGVKADDMLEMVGLAGTSIAKIATSGITNEALEVLDDFMNTELSEKLPAVYLVVPTHIILKISRLDQEMQTIIATRVTKLTFPQAEMNFTWPTPLAMAFEIRNTPKPETKHEAVVVSPTKMVDETPKDAKSENTKPKSVEIPEEHAETIENLRHASKDCMIILDKKGRPDMIVNKKDNTAKKVNLADGGTAFKLHEDAARPAYMMPLAAQKHLDIASRPMRGRGFDDAESIAEFFKDFEGRGLRIYAFWTTE